ncbi:MAG TPA: MBL fold metallo-hydrolase [Smithellaceae bacterium]|nr:MBL fold metallo-hydrolase [Smithellaceae bacterium]HRS89261.1 MBL fold metallo-hydrolase [Smithellaceae bacterium]HRV26281.1 MBL fold metallo-hydrolase [Smithellaceae bacterium]
MLNIEQFRSGDNLAYLIFKEKEAMAIDGVAWQEILSFLEKNNLSLKLIANTHQHYDHTGGNAHLAKAKSAKILTFGDLGDNKKIALAGKAITVYRTPGHTDDSVCFYTGHALVSGDTLFNGTIGNCFSGDLKSFYHSIKRLMHLPDETIIFAGHDYVRDSLAFARHLDPENAEIGKFWDLYNPDCVYSTIADEKKINPYFRFNEKPIIELLQKMNLPHATEWERWQSLMSIE